MFIFGAILSSLSKVVSSSLDNCILNLRYDLLGINHLGAPISILNRISLPGNASPCTFRVGAYCSYFILLICWFALSSSPIDVLSLKIEDILKPGRRDVGGVPEGVDVLLASELASAGKTVLLVLRDDAGLSRRASIAAFFAPSTDIVELPAWDCLPYDRVSPRRAIIGQRLAALGQLTAPAPKGRVVLTTVSAILQKVPPRAYLQGAGRTLEKGTRVDPDDMIRELERFGFNRIETVTEPGEFAVRGGIVDVYPAGAGGPVRLDFFGDELDTLRAFDPATQRSTGEISSALLAPVSEAPLDDAAIARFRAQYHELFQSGGGDDPLYEADRKSVCRERVSA